MVSNPRYWMVFCIAEYESFNVMEDGLHVPSLQFEDDGEKILLKPASGWFESDFEMEWLRSSHYYIPTSGNGRMRMLTRWDGPRRDEYYMDYSFCKNPDSPYDIEWDDEFAFESHAYSENMHYVPPDIRIVIGSWEVAEMLWKKYSRRVGFHRYSWSYLNRSSSYS